MEPERQQTAWLDQVRAAMADPETCAALGRAVLEMQSRLSFQHDVETLEAAAAFERALAIAREDAMTRGHWRRDLRSRGRDPGAPFPEIRVADVAQQLCYDAWEVVSPAYRVALAQLALQLDSDCADAYMILAEETTRTPAEKQTRYEQAMQAGERALGPEMFKREVGSFWGILETRPYMRARFALAEILWRHGDHREAISHLQALLRLNPNDNQGVRYSLASCLLEASDDAGFAALVERWHRILAADAPPKARKDPTIETISNRGQWCSSAPSSLLRSIRLAARYGVLLHPGKKETRWACGTVSPRFEMVSSKDQSYRLTGGGTLSLGV